MPNWGQCSLQVLEATLATDRGRCKTPLFPHFLPFSPFSAILGHFRSIFAHFWPFSANFWPFSPIFGHPPLLAIFGHFRPFSTNFRRPFLSGFGYFLVIFRHFPAILGHFRPFSSMCGPFFGLFSVHFRPCSAIFGPFSPIFGHFRPISAIFWPIFGLQSLWFEQVRLSSDVLNHPTCAFPVPENGLGPSII